MPQTRRQLLAMATGVAGVGALSGCAESTNNAAVENELTAQASFFVFGDLAGTVAGDAATAATLVPVGQHGHGWEPGVSIREEIRTAGLLFHGMDGFQPWVDSITADLTADGAETTAVDVSTDVDLLRAGGGHDHTEGSHEGDSHDEETHKDEKTAHHEADENHEGEDGSHHVEAEDEHQDHDQNRTEASHEGDDHQEHDQNRTKASHEEDGHHEQSAHQMKEAETADAHDHSSGADPHFWMDPQRLRTAVRTIREEFTKADPDNAGVYETNAASLRSRLDDIDSRIESVVSEGSKDVLLVAGHNSFSYFGDRYGIEIQSLTGVGPDDQPSTQDTLRAQDVIETHGLDYVCADPLESQAAAEQLVADTAADAVLPLTAMPGRTQQWADNDWGYLDIMESINIPTLERALDS